MKNSHFFSYEYPFFSPLFNELLLFILGRSGSMFSSLTKRPNNSNAPPPAPTSSTRRPPHHVVPPPHQPYVYMNGNPPTNTSPGSPTASPPTFYLARRYFPTAPDLANNYNYEDDPHFIPPAPSTPPGKGRQLPDIYRCLSLDSPPPSPAPPDNAETLRGYYSDPNWDHSNTHDMGTPCFVIYSPTAGRREIPDVIYKSRSMDSPILRKASST